MKRSLPVLIACLFAVCFAVQARAHEESAHHQQHHHQDADDTGSCSYCGMDRAKFAQSAMMILYEDGTRTPTCSLHCTAVDLSINIDKTPKMIQTDDYNTKKVIDAETACWTLGGDIPGVMTKRAKWAFENKADCDKFAQEHGASVVTFEDAIKAAYEDMYADTKMIRDKRKMKRRQQAGQPEAQPRPATEHK